MINTQTRLSQKNFFIGWFWIFAFSVLYVVIDKLVSISGIVGIVFDGMYILVGIVAVAFGLWLVVYRLHDLGKSGWFALIYLIPCIDFLFLLYLFFKKGDETSNRYGEPNTVSLFKTFLKS